LWLVVTAVIVSVLLAGAVWARPDYRPLLLLTAAAMLLFSGLDIREAIHQGDESNTGLATLAIGIAVLHLAAARLALSLASSRSRPRRA
jgi:hypothetical protein